MIDTEITCFMKPEVGHAETYVSRELKVETVKLVEREISLAQAARDLKLRENMPRKWVKEFGTDSNACLSRPRVNEV